MDDLPLTTTRNPEPAPMAGPGEDGVDWSVCTWKGSRLDQHRRFLALPFRRKLELVEEMCDFARRTMESRRRRGLPFVDLYTGERVGPVSPPPGQAVCGTLAVAEEG